MAKPKAPRLPKPAFNGAPGGYAVAIAQQEARYRRRIREEAGDDLADEAIAAAEAFLDDNPDCAF